VIKEVPFDLMFTKNIGALIKVCTLKKTSMNVIIILWTNFP